MCGGQPAQHLDQHAAVDHLLHLVGLPVGLEVRGVQADRYGAAVAAVLVDDQVPGDPEQPHPDRAVAPLDPLGELPGPQQGLLDDVLDRMTVAAQDARHIPAQAVSFRQTQVDDDGPARTLVDDGSPSWATRWRTPRSLANVN